MNSSIFRSVAVRAVTLPIGILLSLATTWLLINEMSVSTYATFMVVGSVIPLLGFLDLGLSGAVINWTSSMRAGETSRAAFLARVANATSLLIWVGSGLVIVGVLSFLISSRWHVAGLGPVAIAAVIIGLAMPLAMLSRLLVGMGKTTSWSLLQLVQPVMVLAAVGLAVLGSWRSLAEVVPAVGLAAGLLVMARGGMRAAEVRPFTLAQNLTFSISAKSLMNESWPFLVIAFAAPATIHIDRLLLTAATSATQVATYGVAFQMFNPLTTLLSTAGFALWPYYAERRGRGTSDHPFVAAVAFGVAALLLAGSVACVAPWASEILTNHRVHLPAALVGGFAALVVVQAVQLPYSMFLISGSQPRLQAIQVVVMLTAKLLLALFLTPRLGAAGPVAATILAMLVCQLLPQMWMLRDREVEHVS